MIGGVDSKWNVFDFEYAQKLEKYGWWTQIKNNLDASTAHLHTNFKQKKITQKEAITPKQTKGFQQPSPNSHSLVSSKRLLA